MQRAFGNFRLTGFCTAVMAAVLSGQAVADDSAAAAGKALSNPLSDVWALFTEID